MILRHTIEYVVDDENQTLSYRDLLNKQITFYYESVDKILAENMPDDILNDVLKKLTDEKQRRAND